MNIFRHGLICSVVAWAVTATVPGAWAVPGWLHWRGPNQDGTSAEKGLPDRWTLGGTNDLWAIKLQGRGTPVLAGDKLYVWGYEGDGPDLQEVLLCLDAATGAKLWEQRFSDFLSDIIYNRYSIGAPTVDPETGNVYLMTSPGMFVAFTADGKKLWEHSMMEKLGRLALPNGRTGAPVIDGDLVIVRGITGNWGREGVAADRFYAFDKVTGDLVWSSMPGESPPKDGCFSNPVLAWWEGKRVFYAGTGDGSVVCANARTGEPIWRFKLSAVCVNATVALVGDRLVAGHAEENVDSSETGRMIALKLSDIPARGTNDTAQLGKTHELWRNKESVHTSSPVVIGDRLYQVNRVGELTCVDTKTGAVLWRKKLGTEQLHASPTYADGKLYIPMKDDGFYIVRPTDAGAEILSHTEFAKGEEALGAPAIWNGRVYVLTTEKLYCFGSKTGSAQPLPVWPTVTWPAAGAAAKIMARPAEAIMRPGTKKSFRLQAVDANGFFVKNVAGGTWTNFIPPTALVKSTMAGKFDDRDTLTVAPDAGLTAGAWEVTVNGLKGYIRGRTVVGLPYKEDFSRFAPAVQTNFGYAADVKFAWPPLPWIGARFRWDVREWHGEKVFYKTLDRLLFQRAFTYIGDSELSNYTVEADVLSDGNRRMMSNVGLINQRYVINLVGNWQQLEVFSNQERVKQAVAFPWKPNVWYRLKTRVDVAADGTGVVRAKAWPRGEPEPSQWTIEVQHANAHKNGAPGIYGFAPQNQFTVCVDNIEVKSND